MAFQDASASKKTVIPVSELWLTLQFRWKHSGERYLSLFAHDHDMTSYLDLYQYLEGYIPWDELVRRLPRVYPAEGIH